MIFLTVGSALPFDRLVEIVDQAVRSNLVTSDVFAQIGNGSYVPTSFPSVPMLSRAEYDARFSAASAIISHAGIGTIASAIRLRKPLLVLPRDPLLGELVDDHQLKTAHRFEMLGHLLMFTDESSLRARMASLQSFVPQLREPNASGVALAIGSYLSSVMNSRGTRKMSLGQGGCTSMRNRYLIITPCRDEADYLQKTIDSVASQTVLPARWVVVDDGSTDETPQILARAAETLPFLTVVRREDRGRRAVGPGVVDAFYAGLESVDLDDYDFVCKLDGDLEFQPRYFERLMEIMDQDPVLGNVSGKLYLQYGDRLVEERLRDDNAIGPSKFYRVECFKQIGGFVRQVSWDGIDAHTCRLNGWIPAARDEEELRVIHLRRMGSSEISFWEGRKRWGRGKYFMGSRMYYVLALTFYRMFERPFVVSGIGIIVGYLQAAMAKERRYENPDYLRFCRRYELESLLLGRARTTRKYDNRIRQRQGHLRRESTALEHA
jgi:UDP-N-acetylglucosamine transferase subunit ALG13/glycosyltransferase involved in cell wall biosynthesis